MEQTGPDRGSGAYVRQRAIAFNRAICATKGARGYQEDCAMVAPGEEASGPGRTARASDVVAILADGMGGHAGGALASRMVCEKFLDAFSTGDGDTHARLIGALSSANAAIAAKVEEDPALSGMGSTLIGVAFTRDGAQWVSVGDSPLMLYRRGEIALLNEDHSLAPELDRMAEAGTITFEEARRDPRRHMLRSAVTGDDIDLVDISRRPLPLEPGDYIILASDGLQTLDTGEVERIISAYGQDGAKAVAAALIRAVEAVRDPHQDNATVVAVEVVSGS